MEFFCFHRDRVDSGALRRSLVERHWSYMDRYDDVLSLRGPTYDDAERLTGSVHVVDLASPAAAWAFAFEEPGYQAGAYRDVLVRRWHDALGRPVSEYPRRDEPEGLFLVLGFEPEPREAVGPGVDPAGDLPGGDLVAFGHLLDDAGARRLGTAAVVRADDPRQAQAALGGRALVGIETHRWTFGGRR